MKRSRTITRAPREPQRLRDVAQPPLLTQEFRRRVVKPQPKTPLSRAEQREKDEAKRRRRLDERAERRDRFKAEIESADEKQRLVREVLEAQFAPKIMHGQIWHPPGLLDQHHAADKRVWRHKWARKLRLAQRAGLPAGTQFHRYAVTLARPVWIRESLDPNILPEIRKLVQRQTKRLQFPYVVTGVIDVCPIRDVKSGTEGWAFHLHLSIQLAVPTFIEGYRAIRDAYPYKSSSERGVPRGKAIKRIFDGRGWDTYQDKLFQYGHVKLRVVRVDSLFGRRRWPVKTCLRVPQGVELAIFFSKIQADDLMIWVGHRRYGDRVLPMPTSPKKRV